VINLGEADEEKVKIGTNMTKETQRKLHVLLKVFKDIFT